MKSYNNFHPSILHADDIDSDLDEQEFERLVAERPFKLKDKGNATYAEGKYEEAIKLWMESVKETLKQSVRSPSALLYQNQV